MEINRINRQELWNVIFQLKQKLCLSDFADKLYQLSESGNITIGEITDWVIQECAKEESIT